DLAEADAWRALGDVDEPVVVQGGAQPAAVLVARAVAVAQQDGLVVVAEDVPAHGDQVGAPDDVQQPVVLLVGAAEVAGLGAVGATAVGERVVVEPDVCGVVDDGVVPLGVPVAGVSVGGVPLGEAVVGVLQ